MYYSHVPRAIGVLLEKGAFPNLRSLEIEVGSVRAGELLDGGFDEKDHDKPYRYFAWVHNLALSISRAIDSGAARFLSKVSIYDDTEGAYYDNRFRAEEEAGIYTNCLRRAGDAQTQENREHLDRSIAKADELNV